MLIIVSWCYRVKTKERRKNIRGRVYIYTHLFEVYFRLHGLVFSARNRGWRTSSSHQTFRSQCLSPFPSQISPSGLRLPGSYRSFTIDLRQNKRLCLPMRAYSKQRFNFATTYKNGSSGESTSTNNATIEHNIPKRNSLIAVKKTYRLIYIYFYQVYKLKKS